MTEPHASTNRNIGDRRRFDGLYPDRERFPRSLRVSFNEVRSGVTLSVDGRPIGDSLTDARRLSDGYRFHDALHMALAVKLGWSPVLRQMLGRKRRSDPETDRCEDGGRACMVEEAVCHSIYVHRREIGTSDGMVELIRLIQRMTSGFEVETSSPVEWASAIEAGLEAVNFLVSNGGGTLKGDFIRGTLQFAAEKA